MAGSGIGNTLIEGSEQFRMDLVLFGVVVVGVTGWALNALARAVERAMFARRSEAARPMNTPHIALHTEVRT